MGDTAVQPGPAAGDSGNSPQGAPLAGWDIDPALLKEFPAQLARKYLAIPVRKEQNRLTVAMPDPADIVAVDDLRLFTGCEIETVQAAAKDLLALLQKHFSLLDVDWALQVYPQAAEQRDSAPPDGVAVNEAPVVRLVNAIFYQAIEQNASDIHIEPQAAQARVRYRIDGMLRETMTIPRQILAAVISRVKIMSDMDIAEKRLPQDGRFQFSYGAREIDVRLSTLPAAHGEKVVARLLDKGNMQSFNIDRLGFSPLNLRRFTNALKKPNGMLLLTGPTGSGKTTTLYAALNEINTPEKNIITVEDPVEYMLAGINQMQVNPKAGLTFATGLRAILRQDPDIIMVGEIRDRETAQIAVRASMTGHLVLSTLHTNSAAGAITRLVDMGIEPFLVASTVLAAVAQRLVRLICPGCRREYALSAGAPERAFLGVEPDCPVTLYRGAGCPDCGHTGYKGRLAIHEVLPVTAALRALIVRNEPASEIERQACAEAMISLKTDGIEKALAGLTTLEEVMRVAYTDEDTQI